MNGKAAEDMFIRLTGATRPKAVDGDAVLFGRPVEIKSTTLMNLFTLNQVRACKYIPLVVHHSATGTWFVIPASEVVKMVATAKRGQHTENPFECAAITCTWNGMQKWAVNGLDLTTRVKEAMALDDGEENLAKAMQRVSADCKRLSAEHRWLVFSARAMDCAEHGSDGTVKP